MGSDGDAAGMDSGTRRCRMGSALDLAGMDSAMRSFGMGSEVGRTGMDSGIRRGGMGSALDQVLIKISSFHLLIEKRCKIFRIHSVSALPKFKRMSRKAIGLYRDNYSL